MNKECSTCYYCQWNLLHHGYVCENENSPEYKTEIDWLDGICDRWANDKEKR